MNTELHKRIEEEASRFAYKKWLNTAYSLRKIDCKIDFKAGAKFGYKEAIKVAKEWLSKQESWDYYDDRPCKLMTDDRLADFETDMNKLWEQ